MTSALSDLRVLARDHLQRLEAIFRLAPLGIGIVDLEGRTIMSNDNLCQWLGYSAEEFAAMPWTDFTHPDDVAVNLDLTRRLKAGEFPTFTLEKRFIAKDGSIRWAQLSSSMVRHEISGEPAFIIGIVEDITDRRVLERNLLEAEEKFRLLVETVPAVVFIAEVGAMGRWTYVSPKIEQMLGFTAEEWMAEPGLWLRQVHPEDRAEAAGAEELAASGSFQESTCYRMFHRDGSVVHVRDDATLVDGPDGPLWHGVLVDVTKESLLEKELGHLAHHDALTGLPNRSRFHGLVESALWRASLAQSHVAVLFIDLDRFKDVNDTFGHSYGDQVIIEAARRIETSIRAGDRAARLGGDEFAILVEGADASELQALATRVLAALTDRPMHLSGVQVTVGASVGIAAADPGEDVDTVLRNADLAMYQAKRRGGGAAVPYQPELHDAVVTRFRTQGALQEAVASDRIAVALQPIVDLTTSNIVGLEALARWTDPELGPVSPALFIPLAESSGLIRDLGRRMLHRACADLARWRDVTGSDAYVTINASPLQLDGTYLDDVEDALSSSLLEPSALVVEVTEGVMLEPKARECLAELRSRGVRVAIDDFGTGYSSLSYIRDLPVDIVKVDRLFLRPGPQGAHDQPVLRAVVDLVNSLGLVSLLEGVEHPQDLATARHTGAALAQGYLFARPAPFDDLVAELARQSQLGSAEAS